MDIPPPDAMAYLHWGEDLRLASVRGDCPALHRHGRLAPGASLGQALALDEARTLALDVRACAGGGVEFLHLGTSEDGGWVRLSLPGGGRRAWAMDVAALLRGAPPVQVSALSSALSHEMRNPLSSVKLSVQTLARSKEFSERDQKRLTIAQREIRTLERMLTMLAEYGRERPLSMDTMGLKELVMQAVESIGFELKGRQQRVLVDAPAVLPPVRADAHRTGPVLSQLLLNVAAALPEGASLEVRLQATEAGGAVLRVRDLATTLSAEEQAQAFEPFGSRLARGAGLSLAALRQVMLHQDGQVDVHTDEKPGTLFTLAFAPG
jgi:two-component system, NtrC family, sensor histidine kinase HydH